MKNAAILILLTATTALSGCYRGPRFFFENRKVSIDTVPPGAKVYQVNSATREDTFIGTTPIREQPVRILFEVRGKVPSMQADWFTSQIQMLNIRIEKIGYETYKGNLATDPVKTIQHRIPLTPKYP